MLIRFSSKTGSNVSMYKKHADKMLSMMNRSGAIPSALRAEDVAKALCSLQDAVAAESDNAEKESTEIASGQDQDGNRVISTNTRAYPLIQLLKHADSKQEYVMWDYEQGLI